MIYTTILHEPRLRFGLSCNEYCIADSIYHLSNNPSNMNRWCYKSRVNLGESMGLTKQSILNIIDKLVSCGLVEVHPETKHLRTTELWYKNFTNGKESLPLSGKESLPLSGKESLPTGKESLPTGKKSLPQGGKESLPEVVKKVYPIYKDIITDDNNIINKENSEFSKNENYALLSENEFIKSELEKANELIKALEEKEKKGKEKSSAKKESLPKPDLAELCREFWKDNQDKYSVILFKEFLAYWTEKDQKGKERWHAQKFFDLPKRLAKWQSNAIEFNQNKQNGSTSTGGKYQKVIPLTPTGIEPQNGRRFGKL